MLDGWWPEAFDGTNGWEIGKEKDYADTKLQDKDDVTSLYKILEENIVPKYYDMAGNRNAWFKAVKSSIATVTPVFNTEVMVSNYFEELYQYAMDRNSKTNEPDFAIARDLSIFKEMLYENWPLLHFTRVDYEIKNNQVNIDADLYLGELETDDIEVQLYFAYTQDGQKNHDIFVLQHKKDTSSFTSNFGLVEKIPTHLLKVHPQLRVVAKHDSTNQKIELGLMYIKDIAE